MKLTDDNQDYADSRPLGRRSGVATDAFQQAFEKALAGKAKGTAATATAARGDEAARDRKPDREPVK